VAALQARERGIAESWVVLGCCGCRMLPAVVGGGSSNGTALFRKSHDITALLILFLLFLQTQKLGLKLQKKSQSCIIILSRVSNIPAPVTHVTVEY
jgi:hypothetical protein